MTRDLRSDTARRTVTQAGHPAGPAMRCERIDRVGTPGEWHLLVSTRRVARSVGLALALLGAAACASAPVATPDPAALPLDFAVVWDVPGWTDADGRGPYFDTPSSPRLAAGPVLVSWWCDGSGLLAVAPGHVDHPPDLPSPQSPLAFQVSCPTAGSFYADWRQLAAPAVGGENALDIHPVASPSAAIRYRILFAQQRT